MEVLNLIRLFWGWVFPYISRIHTAYIGENLHFRYLKCSAILFQTFPFLGQESMRCQGPWRSVELRSFEVGGVPHGSQPKWWMKKNESLRNLDKDIYLEKTKYIYIYIINIMMPFLFEVGNWKTNPRPMSFDDFWYPFVYYLGVEWMNLVQCICNKNHGVIYTP